MNKKIALSFTEFYLALLSVYYIVLSVCVILPIQSFRDNAIPLAFFGMVPGFVPTLAMVSQKSSLASSSFSPIIVSLAVLALTLGILGLVSLVKIKRNPKWIRLWYFIAFLSIVIAVSNLMLSPMGVYSIISPVCMFFAVRNLRKVTLQSENGNFPQV